MNFTRGSKQADVRINFPTHALTSLADDTEAFIRIEQRQRSYGGVVGAEETRFVLAQETVHIKPQRLGAI